MIAQKKALKKNSNSPLAMLHKISTLKISTLQFKIYLINFQMES
nr:MAG TPA: hypothetical protein [Caudoviricetes sp.]